MTSAAVLGVIRPPFLVLTPVCVLLGLAAAVAQGQPTDWPAAAIALVGAICAHMSVNALNEYGDFRSGLDFLTQRTPFSGGSGTLVSHPDLASCARTIGHLTFVLTALAGLLLLWRAGLSLLPLGVAGLALVYFYTGPINRNRYLCLIAPGLGFGPLMVVGTTLAVTGELTATAMVASLIPFFLVSNLLLLNQFPDVGADRAVGRDNLPISVGLSASLKVYGLFAALAYLSLIAGWAAGLLPRVALLALVTAPVAAYLYRGVADYVEASGDDAARLVPYLGLNVLVTLATPALVAVGLALGN